MAALISLGLFAVLMTTISIYGYRRYAKPGRVYEQLGGPADIGGSMLPPRSQSPSATNPTARLRSKFKNPSRKNTLHAIRSAHRAVA